MTEDNIFSTFYDTTDFNTSIQQSTIGFNTSATSTQQSTTGFDTSTQQSTTVFNSTQLYPQNNNDPQYMQYSNNQHVLNQINLPLPANNISNTSSFNIINSPQSEIFSFNIP